MSISKSYYKVRHTRGKDLINEFSFDDEKQEVRYRREAALYKFFELIDDIHIKNDAAQKIEFEFYEHYIERDSDGGVPYDFDCAQKFILFEVIKESVNVNWSNWIRESNAYLNSGETYFDYQVVIVTDKGKKEIVLNDRICQKLNIPFEY